MRKGGKKCTPRLPKTSKAMREGRGEKHFGRAAHLKKMGEGKKKRKKQRLRFETVRTEQNGPVWGVADPGKTRDKVMTGGKPFLSSLAVFDESGHGIVIHKGGKGKPLSLGSDFSQAKVKERAHHDEAQFGGEKERRESEGGGLEWPRRTLER